MGGVAGHMNHPFDIDNFTFGKYKQLIRDLFNGKVEHITEKLDGMNVYATVDLNSEVRFARNLGHIRNDEGGMNIKEMEERWSKPEEKGILEAYINAYNIFNDFVCIFLVKFADVIRFFNGKGYKIYANCEILDKDHPNAISYYTTTLSIHNLVLVPCGEHNGEDDTEILKDREHILNEILPLMTFYGKIQLTPEIKVLQLEKTLDNNEIPEKHIGTLEVLQHYNDLDDNSTMLDYKKQMLLKYLDYFKYNLILDSPFIDRFIDRWIYGVKKPSIIQLRKEMLSSGAENAEEIYSAAVNFEKETLNAAMKEIMSPIQILTYRLGNDIISICRGFANEGSEEKVANDINRQFNDSLKMVCESKDIETIAEMRNYLNILAQLGYKCNVTEGIVFNYNGKKMKLTGSFAPLNRAIHINWGKKKKNQEV